MAAKLTALQFFFALTWVVYVIYLPALAAQAGIERQYVPWILVMDQAIFVLCDWAAGVHADRLARALGGVGRWMASVALVSCAAFLAMPFVAPLAGVFVFLALVVLWSASSSALRAPPLVIASRYSRRDERPWLASFYILGIGLATALAPYLGIALKDVDPRVPFVAASLGVALFALVASRAEPESVPRGLEHEPGGCGPSGRVGPFAAAVLLFAIGLQLHVAVASAPAYRRFATAEELVLLNPVFWIGFNVAALPAALLSKRYTGFAVMSAAGLAGAVALFACTLAPSLATLILGQAVAGACWGAALSGAISAALETGRPGREGFVTGILFSMLAAAALARIAFVATGVAAPESVWTLPPVAWGLAAVVILVAARNEPKPANVA